MTPPPQSAAAEVLLRACSDALLATCVSSTEAAPPNASRAQVLFLDETSVRIELASIGSEPPAEPRFMLFRSTDPERERFQSIGLVVAALALGREAEPEATSNADAVPARPEPANAPVWVGVAGEVGSGLDNGGPRLGARLDAAIRPRPLQPAIGIFTAGFARSTSSDGKLAAAFVQVGAGIGVASDLETIGVELRFHAGPIVEIVTASRDEKKRDNPDATRWLLGARAGVSGTWPSAGPVGAFVALSGWHLSGATGIRVEGVPVATAPAAAVGGQVGIEVRFDP